MSFHQLCPVNVSMENLLNSMSEGEPEDNDNDLGIAHRVKARRVKSSAANQKVTLSISDSRREEDDISFSVSSSTTSQHNTAPAAASVQTGDNNTVITNLLSCISRTAPASIFNPRKSKKLRQKRRKLAEKKAIHPDLMSVWTNAATLYKDPDTRRVYVPRPYPKVDWSKVNKRLISHIPDPTPQPVLGCHQDAAFYESKEVLKPHVPGTYPKRHTMVMPSKFKEKNPFGTLPGYLTDAGVIHPHSNTQMVHGYVWSPSLYKYILHAEFQCPEKENVKKVKERDKPNSKRDGRRKRRVALDDL